MIILCTHNDGGVGKTTLAVHAARVLISQLNRTLLIDCDDQADFWQFYTGRTLDKSQDLDTEGNRTVIFNKDRKSIKGLAKP
ncbi:AAA family ATPase [Iningainema tapete]|uniref:AAA family ATPase n=1 Tax=Iningainema tapete TaxID=2806730 RepID=UPI001EE2C825|nr:AAA family ATPase [Iningainema tapete]